MDSVEQQIQEILAEGMGDDDSKSQSEAVHDEQAPENTVDDDPTVASLLAEQDDDNEPVEDEDQEGEDSADPESDPEPITLKDLAEQLEVDVKDLYDELSIPMGDGESLTLGEFKDRAKDLREIDTVRNQVEDSKADFERETVAMRAELSQLLNIIPPEMRDQLMSASAQQHTGYVNQQKEAVLEAIPEWKDPDILAKDRDAIVALGQSYGFSESEMVYTHDARTLKVLHDFLRLRGRMDGSELEAKRNKKKRPGQPGRRNRNTTSGKLRARMTSAKQSGDVRQAESVVADLIRTQK